MAAREVVICSAARTPIGSFGGKLKDVSAVDLGCVAVRAVLERVKRRPAVDPSEKAIRPSILQGAESSPLEKKYAKWDSTWPTIKVDDVIMGHVLQAGQGQNTARQVAIKAGLPQETSACAVNKVCGSGMRAVTLAVQAIVSGNADCVIAGGMESMSNAPYSLPKARWGYRMDVGGCGQLDDLVVVDALYEQFYGYHMGITAENIAREYKISREEQDALGVESHARALKAVKDGTFAEEIVPVLVPQRRGDPIEVDTDERPAETSLAEMGALRPVFITDGTGTVTAGNASGINDGAAALLLCSREYAEANGLPVRATVVGQASGGVDPQYMGLGPIPAVRKVLQKAKLTVDDMDSIELNEAFAVQALACMKDLGLRWPSDRVNPHGSGVSLGHPVGCTGARILVTLVHELERKKGKNGLACLCIGGGQGMAVLLSRT